MSTPSVRSTFLLTSKPETFNKLEKQSNHRKLFPNVWEKPGPKILKLPKGKEKIVGKGSYRCASIFNYDWVQPHDLVLLAFQSMSSEKFVGSEMKSLPPSNNEKISYL